MISIHGHHPLDISTILFYLILMKIHWEPSRHSLLDAIVLLFRDLMMQGNLILQFFYHCISDIFRGSFLSEIRATRGQFLFHISTKLFLLTLLIHHKVSNSHSLLDAIVLLFRGEWKIMSLILLLFDLNILDNYYLFFWLLSILPKTTRGQFLFHISTKLFYYFLP